MSTTFGEVVGRNIRTIRQVSGKTLDDVVYAGGRYGGKYSTGNIGKFESGGFGATLKNLLIMAATLSELSGQTVTLADLCAGSGEVVLGGVTVDLADLRDALSGKPVQLKQRQPGVREPERRLMRELDMSLDELDRLSQQLWGRSFHDERDRRASGGNAQHRGQAARDLKAELRGAQKMRNPQT